MELQMARKRTKHRSRRLCRFLRADEAVSALEYAILVGAMAVAVGAAIVAFSDDLQTAIGNIGESVAAIDMPTPAAITPDTTVP